MEQVVLRIAIVISSVLNPASSVPSGRLSGDVLGDAYAHLFLDDHDIAASDQMVVGTNFDRVNVLKVAFGGQIVNSFAILDNEQIEVRTPRAPGGLCSRTGFAN